MIYQKIEVKTSDGVEIWEIVIKKKKTFYICPKCNATFQNKTDFRLHVRKYNEKQININESNWIHYLKTLQVRSEHLLENRNKYSERRFNQKMKFILTSLNAPVVN